MQERLLVRVRRAARAARGVIETQGVELAKWLGECAGLVSLVALAFWGVQALPRPSEISWDHVPGMTAFESRQELLTRVAKEHEVAQQQGAEKASLAAENERMRAEIGDWQAVVKYSRTYHIAPDLAKDIIDASKKAGVDHDLAFRLINVESQFHEHATSPVGARGLTQVMPGVQGPAPHVNPDSLYSRRVNLGIGLRFLKDLVDQYHGNMHLALVAYNRGPAKMDAALRACREGRECRLSNGYDKAVLGE